MRHFTIPRGLEERLYLIILVFASLLSAVSIAGNLLAGFPLILSVKWVLLIVASLLAIIGERSHTHDWPKVVYFLFIICIFLPFAFFQSGGSDNNALGYTFLILVSITYLFKGRTRVLLAFLLSLQFLILLSVEYVYPHLVASHSDASQYIDRMIQVPIQLLAIFLMVLQFSRAYDADHRMLLRLSNTDELTGLHNRSRMNEICQNVSKSGEPCVLVITDIDDFKRVNDTYGHQAGDRVLIEFSGLLETFVRECPQQGFLGRWGGEEFLLLFTDSDGKEVKDRIESLRERIVSNRFSYQQGLTSSFGMAEKRDDKESFDELFARADRALYEAKSRGKDRLVEG